MGFNKSLGIRLVGKHKDGVTIECALRPDLLNSSGVLHGGVSAAVADAAVGIALWQQLGASREMTTVEMKINYFLPVKEGKLRARSRLLRVGKSICVGQVELFDSSRRLVGAALVTYMLLGER